MQCGGSIPIPAWVVSYFEAEWDFAKWNGWFNGQNTQLNWLNKYVVINKM